MAPLRSSRNRRSAASSAPSNSTPNTPAPAPGNHQAGLAVGAQTAQQMNATVQRAARQIRGPQSALTDFLASHNISANQIRQDANARRAAALADQQTENGGGGEEEEPESEPEPAPRKRRNETKAQEKKRKQEEEKAIAKIKASKKFQRKRRGYASDDDVTDEDEAARAIFKESMAPVPGQMENCEICDKRFTVTGYSRAGPDGGLLCPTCTREIDKEEGAERKRKQTAHRNKRRKIQSDLLDGIYPGAKDLVTLCVETLAKNVDMAEDFGDLPPALIDRLAQILAKKRLMNPSTLDLFLRPGSDTVTIYEGAKLSSDDYIRIFQIVPTVKHLRIRNGVQFKNKVMDHLLGTTVALESLSLHGANLIDNERWDRFLQEKGHTLKALKVYYTDGQFGDQQVEFLMTNTPNLERLKISHNQRVSDAGLKHIAKLSNLKHLGLELYEGKTSSEPYVEILNAVGPNLRTLSLGQVHYLNDTVLEAIHDNCQNISKLRITDNEVFTDKGFAALFTNWYNPPLTFVDLHKCRHLDSAVPRDNPDGIGLCSLGFTALMQHSGSRLKYLNIHSCRHISAESFEKAFDKDKKYPDMLNIDISFCQAVNDFIVGSIFRSCPNLKTLKVFGNFGVRNVKVPKGKILIGMPNALGMQIEGADDEGREI